MNSRNFGKGAINLEAKIKLNSIWLERVQNLEHLWDDSERLDSIFGEKTEIENLTMNIDDWWKPHWFD